MPFVPKHQPGQVFSAFTYTLTIPLQKLWLLLILWTAVER